VEELLTLRKIGSRLQGHPDMTLTPGVDMSAGSLGLGISSAAGMALAGKIDGKDYRVYTVVGDGESEEGQVWEACMFASHYKLDNLCVIIDWNGLQIDGPVAEVMNPTPHDKKLEAFGFHVISIDGNDLDQIEAAFKEARTVVGKPCAIIAKKNVVKRELPNLFNMRTEDFCLRAIPVYFLVTAVLYFVLGDSAIYFAVPFAEMKSFASSFEMIRSGEILIPAIMVVSFVVFNILYLAVSKKAIKKK
jgi:hypothetical protein